MRKEAVVAAYAETVMGMNEFTSHKAISLAKILLLCGLQGCKVMYDIME